MGLLRPGDEGCTHGCGIEHYVCSVIAESEFLCNILALGKYIRYISTMQADAISKIREFNRFYTGLIGVTNNHILESPYSLTEVRVMFEIYQNPDITARQIKEIVQVDEGYLSRLIAKLVKQKIVIKTKSKKDSRVFSLGLSKNGEKIFLGLNQKSSDAIAKMIAHLNKAEKKELVEHLSKIKFLITKHSSGSLE